MNKPRTVFLHAIIWLSILLLFVGIGSRGGKLEEAVVIFVYFGLLNIAIFYINYLYILPKYLNSRRYLGCALSIIFLILFSGFIKYTLASFFSSVVLKRGPQHQITITFWEYYLGTVFTGTFFVFLSTAAKFAVDWFVNEKVRKNLENEKLIAELAFLKSQINPHFLFNSLNNIYSLAYQHSEKTPEAILKLSEIMRYMLQESNEVKVELSKEIRYLENYIELQKLRFKADSYVSMDIKGDDMQQSIAPLILIAFVENAFKHGVASDPENPIAITIDVMKGRLFFSVKNKKSAQNKDEASGIGLNNVKRRLDLLYPGKYELEINEGREIYHCTLVLDL